MTFTISKTKLAIAIVAVAMLLPTSAMAFHVFDDVPDDKFYADPVEWAFDNGITTGRSPTSFAPDDGVTRGESVTFLKRYDDNIVQPALATLTSDVAANTADIADLPTVYAVRVDLDGTLLQGPTGSSSTRTGTGFYDVTFPVDVSECVWQVTPTNGPGLFVIDSDQVFAALQQDYTFSPFEAIEEQIIVRIKDEDGNAFSNRFDLVVHC